MRILLGLALLAASLLAHPFDRGVAQAQQIVLPCVPSGNSCIPVSAANPLPTTGGGGGGGITPGTTTCTSCTANNLLYTDGTLVQELATANSGVLVTSAGGVPSISTTLPSGLTIPGYLTSLVIGTTAITGGATTQVLFNNGGVLGSDAGLTKVSGATGAVTFGGPIILPSGAALTPSVAIGSTTNGIYASSTTIIDFAPGGSQTYRFSTGGFFALGGANLVVSSGGGFFISSGTAGAAAVDTTMCRQSAGIVEIGSGTGCGSGGALYVGVINATLSAATGTNTVCNTPGTNTALTVQVWSTGCAASSARFKTDLTDIPDAAALGVMAGLKPRSYRYRPGEGDGGADIHFGFTAEQVREIDPDLITFEADGTTPHAVKYNELWAFSAGAIRSLKARVDALEAR
jgi:hypothetical protein